MGLITRQISENITRYYWYPGDKKEWARAGIALLAGGAVFGAVWLTSRHLLAAVVSGASVTAVFAGANFGRRDARALAGFPDLGDKAIRRETVVHTGRAAWRGLVEGVGGAGAAVLIVNLPDRGIVADWLLPVVPVLVGALAHQAGMIYERFGHASASAAAVGPPADATMETAK